MSLVIKRPWGWFERFTINKKSTVKLLHVKAGKRNSYQYHHVRSEFWSVARGKVRVTLNGKSIILNEGGSIKIPVRARHRVEALTDAVILEIATGKFDEQDNIRVEDDWGRRSPR